MVELVKSVANGREFYVLGGFFWWEAFGVVMGFGSQFGDGGDFIVHLLGESLHSPLFYYYAIPLNLIPNQRSVPSYSCWYCLS